MFLVFASIFFFEKGNQHMSDLMTYGLMAMAVGAILYTLLMRKG